MNEERPPTELYVKAKIRVAAQEGVPITVVRKGNPSVGTIVLKINLLNGTSRVLIEARNGENRVWMPATRTDPMAERDAEAYLARQADVDPDVWIVEVEDKKGRLWFSGDIVAL